MNILEQSQSWFSRLKIGLSASSSKISSGLTKIFTHRKIDKDSLEQLEELLISADIGVETSAFIIAELALIRYEKDIDLTIIKQTLASIIIKILKPVAQDLIINNNSPQIIMVCGVNGNGKTTTIGKLASHYKSQGKSVMLAACDTFRAAASSQLEVWASRANCPIITGAENADPASVAYQAIEESKAKKIDILLIDTAGRLHNKINLMEELGKVIRVIKKLDSNAPHNTILVLDATTGQNAYSQVENFLKTASITGLIITKLDGTAKAGVVVGLAKKFHLPIHAIGVGEQINDLQVFDPESFANNLVG